MPSEHPDAPKQFGIRLSNEVMTLVSEIQEHRKQINKPITLAAVVEDAIRCHYNRLVKEGDVDPGERSRVHVKTSGQRGEATINTEYQEPLNR
jgi:hypothetical protein